MRDRFKALRSVFGDKHLPGDLSAAICFAKNHQAMSMCKCEPALELLSVQGKYGPWKDSLLIAWRDEVRESRSARCSWQGDIHNRSDRLLHVLARACQLMAATDYRVWVQCCGRGVTHHSGFIPLLLRLKVLRRGTSTQGSKSLRLGVNGTRYCLCNEARRTKLKEYIHAADKLRLALSCIAVPRSLEDYWVVWRKLTKARKDHSTSALNIDAKPLDSMLKCGVTSPATTAHASGYPPPLPRPNQDFAAMASGSSGYLFAWTLRTLLVSRMRVPPL